MEIYKYMNKICTSIEQSKKLLELGIDVKTADMFWDTLFAKKPEAQVNNHHFIDEYDDEHRVPAWSLTALLELIPPGNILLRDALSGKYKCINTVDSNLYDNPVNAAFDMVCWLKENKKI